MPRVSSTFYVRLVRGYAAAGGLYYGFVTPLAFTLPHQAVWPMFVCTAVSSLISAAIWRQTGRPGGLSVSTAAAVLNATLLFNVVLHTFLVADAHLLIYFAPIALIMAVMGPTLVVAGASLTTNAAAALLCGHFMPQAYRSEFVMAVGTVTFGAAVLSYVMHKAVAEKARVLSELDAALQRSEALAARAQAAEAAKARFIANVSHEIRNPLGGMLGLADGLTRTPLTQEQAQMAGLLLTSARMLETLVSEVLDLEKLNAGKVQLRQGPLDIAAELHTVAQLFAAQAAAKGLELDVSVEPAGPILVVGDATRLRQIISNLLSNAVKFTEAGRVRVGLQCTIDEAADAYDVELRVEDTGIGFEPEACDRLFIAFEQAEAETSNRFGGSGLGLTISRALAREMDGELVASSTPDVGSLFTLTLRLRRAERVTTTSETRADATAPSGLRVLAAEDNAALRKVIELLLRPIGAELVFAEDGREAVEASCDQRFDLILMDLNMPRLDGIGATRRIRAFERAAGVAETPIVIISAHTDAERRSAALNAGAAAMIAKPIKPHDLYAAITAAIGTGSEATDPHAAVALP